MAYTKYSLTPADNNAAPPNGAPEGMLPSAVNDTMRDMMSQIRDVGDGIRGGTYTMTAPVITGGSITGVALSGNTLTNPVITGGSINNTPIGATTANTGAFTTLGATGVATFSAGTVSAPAITTTGDTNTGIFFPAADTIAFTEGGVEAARFDASGNLGVGTVTPTANRRLDAVISSNASAGIRVTNSNGGASASSNTSYSNGTSNHEFGILGTAYTTYGVLSASEAYIYGSNQNISFGADGTSAVIKFGTGAGIPERMRITSGGNLLVGDTGQFVNGGRLHVRGIDQIAADFYRANSGSSNVVITRWVNSDGGGTVIGTMTTNGSLTISGALSKGSGSFRIDHPLAEKTETHQLVHSFVESPQADNIYRGKTTLINGHAKVNIDEVAGMTNGTFVALNREVQCFTSNESDWDAVRGSVIGNILTIECQNSISKATISWLVIGERQDKHMYETDWTDENGKVIVEPIKTNKTLESK
jgi:hypothetical protein